MKRLTFVFLIAVITWLLGLSYATAQDQTSQKGIGIYDLILSNTNFTNVKCESHECKLTAQNNNITMDMKRVGFDLFLNRDLNIILDINVNSILFNCKEEGPCRSGLVVHYHNDPNLIRVYIKNSKQSIEATTKEEIKVLRGWLNNALKVATSS